MKINNKLTLVVSVALSLSACSPSMTADEYLSQALEFSEKRDHNSAIIALKNAVRIDAKDPNIRFALGAAYLAQGDYLSAEKELEKAEQFGSDNERLISKLVQTKVKLNKFDAVYQIAEQNEAYSAAEQIIILTYAGIAAIHQSKPKRAKEYIEQAVSISDDSVYGRIGQAYLSHSGNNYKDGLNTVDELLTSSPDFAEALLLKGYLLQASEQFDEAAEVFEQYAKLRPKDITVRFFIAQNYVFSQNFAAAEPQVDLLLKISQYHPLANQLKAEIEYSKQHFKEAKEYAVIAFQQDSSSNLAKIIAGISAYKLDDFEQSYQYLISVKDILPPDHLVRKLIIDLQFKLGYDTEAVVELQSLADLDLVDSNMLTQASNQMLAAGNIAAAQELLQSSIALDVSNPIELAKQGVTQLRLNQADKGIERLEKALELDPDLSFAEQNLAIGYLANNQLEKALVFAKKWQASEELRVQGFLLEASILEKQQQTMQAKALLEKVLSLDPDNIPAQYKLAKYAHQEGNNEQAFSFYTQVLKQQPQHLSAIINFTRLIVLTQSINDKFQNKAIAFYQTELAKQPQNNHSKLGLAYIFKVSKNYDAALELLLAIASSKESLQGIEIALGDVYIEQGEWQAAISEYQKFVDRYPESLKTVQKLFGLFEQYGQLDKALVQLEKMLAVHHGNINLLLLKSYYKSVLKNEPNQEVLAKLKASDATRNHWLLDKTLGNFAYNRKDFDASIRHYASAYQKQANDMNVMNWSKSVALNGNKKQALAILDAHIKSLAEEQQGTRVKMMLAGAYLNNNQFVKAITIYQSIIKYEPENVIALNNVSYIELQLEHYASALTYGKKAADLAPKSSAILDTYAQALVANNQLQLALDNYDEALSIANGNAEISIHKAQALLAADRHSNAKSLLLSLVNTTASEKNQINELLEKIK